MINNTQRRCQIERNTFAFVAALGTRQLARAASLVQQHKAESRIPCVLVNPERGRFLSKLRSFLRVLCQFVTVEIQAISRTQIAARQ